VVVEPTTILVHLTVELERSAKEIKVGTELRKPKTTQPVEVEERGLLEEMEF
jgi:hypothetical protein